MEQVEYVTSCYACAQGLYAECLDPAEAPNGLIIPCGHRYQTSEERNSAGGGALAPDQITDTTSTGRKRAAMLAPIMTGMLCEWAGLRQAGGGVIPIVGCAGAQLIDKKQVDPDYPDYLPGHRHHGPDKAVINNSVGQNLHRICPNCHNRWHTLNDPFYGERGEAHEQFLPLEPYYLHDPNTEATVEEQELVEAWWATKKEKRGPYPIEPNDLRKIAP